MPCRTNNLSNSGYPGKYNLRQRKELPGKDPGPDFSESGEDFSPESSDASLMDFSRECSDSEEVEEEESAQSESRANSASIMSESNEEGKTKPAAEISFMGESNEKGETTRATNETSFMDESNEKLKTKPAANETSFMGGSNGSGKTKLAVETIKKGTKINYCPICNKPISTQFARHLQSHKEHPEVKKLSNLKDKTERRRMLDLMRANGNLQHNMTILKSEGSCKLVTKSSTISHYDLANIAECPSCHGCYSKDNLYKHRKRCAGVSGTYHKNTHSQRSTLDVLAEASKDPANEHFVKVVMGSMRKDELYEIIASDSLIKHYGTRMYAKYRHLPHLVNYVSQKTREVARLVQSARRLKPEENLDLKKLLKVDNWDLIIESVKDAAGFTPEKNAFMTPSLALKLGYTMNRITHYEEMLCIIHKDTERIQEIKNLQTMLAKDLPEKVSRYALETLHVAKFNAPKAIPLSEDIAVFYTYLKTEVGKKLHELREDRTNSKLWYELAQLAACYLIVFNRRRPGELSRLELSTYAKKSKGYVDDDIAKSLSKSERLLASSMTLVEIRGKRGKKVPVLINKLSEEAIDLLISTRTTCSVLPANPYVFAVPASKTAVRASDAIREAAEMCGAQEPQTLRCTKLRKHVATTCQILHLDEHDQEQLATFLGHDLRVHKEFYRLPSGALQLARLSKIFTLMDRGQITAGKNLSLAELDVKPDDAVEDIGSDVSEAEQDLEPPLKKKRKVRNNCESEEEFSEPESPRPRASRKPNKKKPQTRKEWTPAERAAVKKHLANFIATKKVPGKQECEAVLEKEEFLRKNGRTWTHVKFFVKNAITRSSNGKPLLSPLKVSPLKQKARHRL